MSEERTVVSELSRRLSDGTLSRRGFIRRAIAAGVSAPAIAAALAEAGSAAARAAAPARQIDAKTLVIADNLRDTWITLDPGWYYEINPGAAMNVTVEPLYELPDSTKPAEFAPLLAADLPQVSADGLEVTIPLRQGVTFHSGNPFTADDVIFSWTRLKNIKFQGAFLASDYWDTVEAVDPTTIKLTLKSPNAAIVPILSSMPLAIVDSVLLKENGGTDAEDADQTDTAKEWINAGNAVGTGPYKLTAWDIEGEVIVERNDTYWGEAPALDRIIWRNIVDTSSQLQAVESGEADIAYSLDPDTAAAVRDNPELQLISGPTLAHQYLALNTTAEKGGPLATKELRQAIGYAIDYDGIINDLLAGAAIKPATIAPEPLLGTEAVRDLGYTNDLATAQERFAAAGGEPVELMLTYGSGQTGEGGLDLETLATKLKADLERIDGLTIKLEPMDGATRLEEFRAGNLQFTISSWSPDYPDIHTYAEPFGKTDTAAARRVGFSNAEVDAWLAAGIAESDPVKREELYVNVLKTLIEEAPFLVLYQPIDQKAATKAVQGVATHSVYMIQLRNASKTA